MEFAQLGPTADRHVGAAAGTRVRPRAAGNEDLAKLAVLAEHALGDQVFVLPVQRRDHVVVERLRLNHLGDGFADAPLGLVEQPKDRTCRF